MKGPGNENPLGLRLSVRTHSHETGFGETRATVIDRSVGGIHRRQAGDHRLILIDDLKRALARFGLIRRVRSHEFTALDEVPDRGRYMVVVGAGASKAEYAVIERSAGAEVREHLHLTDTFRYLLEGRRAEALGDFVEERIDIGDADHSEHRIDVGRRVRNEWHARRELHDGREGRRCHPAQARAIWCTVSPVESDTRWICSFTSVIG